MQIMLLCSLFINLGKPALYYEEPRRALIALEMMYNDNLLVPTELGEYYYKKPPVYNWLLIGSYKIFGGASEFAVRFFSAFSHWLIGLMIFAFSRRWLGQGVALLAACLWWVSIDLYFYFSMFGEIDLFYSAITFAAIMLLYPLGKAKRYALMFGLVYGLHAIGFLTKGLPSIAFAGISTLVYLAMNRKWKMLISWQHFLGIFIFLALTGGYFFAYSQFNSLDGFVRDLWSQSADRTAAGHKIGDFFIHLVKFPLIIFKDLLPGSLMFLFLIPARVRRKVLRDPFLKFCLFMALANLALYWISPGNRSRYIYMLYPFLLIPSAFAFWHFWDRIKWANSALNVAIWILPGAAFIACLSGPWINNFLPAEAIIEWQFDPTILCLVFAGVFGIILLLQGRSSQYRVWFLIFSMICGRLFFDLGVIPIRASTGMHEVNKQNALEIAEITKDKDLHLWQFKNEGWFSLAMTFYIERERKQVLDIVYEANTTDYFIGFDHEFDAYQVQIHKGFNWREFKYYLVTFEAAQ